MMERVNLKWQKRTWSFNMNTEQIKIGDKVRVKKQVSHNLVDCLSFHKDMEFIGKVEKIEGQIIYTDNPASVHKKHIVEILK